MNDMETITPQELEKWIAILSKPTLGVIGFIVLILYRELVIHIGKSIADIVASWVKRRP